MPFVMPFALSGLQPGSGGGGKRPAAAARDVPIFYRPATISQVTRAFLTRREAEAILQVSARGAKLGKRAMRYRMQEGEIAWILHRVTGAAVVAFLLLHISDITLIGWGPGLFDKLLFIYRAWPFRVMEVFLLAGVLFHALNGIRIILIDFWPAAAGFQKKLFYGEMALFTVAFIPAAYLMLR
jgi:succinate dehydrogenase / fumarate reductase cytochrome b subunit